MKKLLLLICLLPMASMAQINTYVITQTGQAEFDTARVFKLDSLTTYVTPSQLSDSLTTVGGGTDTNALTTNTPISTTLDTVQRNGVNSALSIATDRVYVNGNIVAEGTGSITTTNGSIIAGGTGTIYTVDGDITVGGASKRFIGNYLTPSEMLITDGSKNIVSAPVATYPSLTELTYLKGVTSAIQTQINGKQSTISFGTGVQTALGINIGSAGAPVLFNGALGTPSSGTLTNATGLPQSGVTNLTTDLGLKAPLANPTFTGVVTIPTPFTLGATSVTSTGTQLNYLSSATGTTGTTSTNLVFSTSPTLVTPNLGTPSTLVGTNITGTASGLTAGNVTTNANLTGVVTSVGNATSFATSPAFTGNVTATNTTDITLGAESALRVGGAANSTNLTLGEYSTGVGLQARNNGAIGVLNLNPLGGDTRVGAAAPAGASNFTLFHTGTGTGDYAEISGRNGAGAAADGLLHRTFGTSWATAGSNFQDGAASMTGTNLSGGYSIGTQASADLRFYSNNTLRTTIQAGGNTIHTARVQLSKGANVASAGNLTLGSAGNVFTITGTTTINALTTTNWQAGSEVTLIFSGILTLKNNTAGGASTAKILTKTGADITTAANYVFKCVYDGTNWLQSN